MSNTKELLRKAVNNAASHYLSDQEDGDLYDAYLKLQEAEENDKGGNLAADYVTVWQPLEHMSVNQILEVIDSELQNMDEPEAPAFMQNMDWDLLRQQKKSLLGVIENTDNVPVLEHLEGIVVLIDAMQDYAVDIMGLDEKDVFLFEKETEE